MCDCGELTEVRCSHLTSGNVRSCGCLVAETNDLIHTTHGHSKVKRTPEYISWQAMMGRCYTLSHVAFDKYGGRGIKVCDAWHEFENFFQDMGNRPTNMSLDRIDVNGNYCLENCRWATPSQQQNNIRNNVKLFYKGENLTINEWASRINICSRTIKGRIKLGWTVEKTLTTPLQREIKNGN